VKTKVFTRSRYSPHPSHFFSRQGATTQHTLKRPLAFSDKIITWHGVHGFERRIWAALPARQATALHVASQRGPFCPGQLADVRHGVG